MELIKMKCYVHRENEAIGVCSVCFKAICAECAHEKDGKLVCVNCYAPPAPAPAKGAAVCAGVAVPLPPPPSPQKEGFLSGIFRAVFPHDSRMPIQRAKRGEMITPIFLVGLLLGIVLGVPVLNIFFFPIIIVGVSLGIFVLRAEGHFTSLVSVRDGAVLGFVTCLFAVFVSTLMMVSLEVLLAPWAYSAFNSLLPFIQPEHADIFLKLISLDKDLSLVVVQLQFLGKLIIYPLTGALGGYLAAKYMR